MDDCIEYLAIYLTIPCVLCTDQQDEILVNMDAATLHPLVLMCMKTSKRSQFILESWSIVLDNMINIPLLTQFSVFFTHNSSHLNISTIFSVLMHIFHLKYEGDRNSNYQTMKMLNQRSWEDMSQNQTKSKLIQFQYKLRHFFQILWFFDY